MSSVHYLTVFGLILIFLGSLLSLYGQQKITNLSDRRAFEQSQALEHLGEKNSRLSTELLEQARKNVSILSEKSEKIEELSQENLELAKEINRLNERIVDSVTGGDEFCFFKPLSFNSETGMLDLILECGTKFPVYDVSVRVVDLNELTEKMTHLGFGTKDYRHKGESLVQGLKRFYRKESEVIIGNVSPGQVPLAQELKAIKEPIHAFDVKIYSRNGKGVQRIRFFKNLDRWLMAMQHEFEDEIVVSEIDEGFPRNEKGDVKWYDEGYMPSLF